MSWEITAIVGVFLVVLATVISPKLGVATPLLLVALGFGLTFAPGVGSVTVNPAWILAGILPPLLYSAAVATPVMEFRRDFRLISAFSVLLVVISAVVIGALAVWIVPGLPWGLGIALGAIVSPTDAVATSIVRQAGVSTRIVTVLEGESMLNDASALVLLRSAVAALGVTASLWQIGGQFIWSVAAAVGIGWVVGEANMWVRRWLISVPAGVALSLVVPYVAYLPAEHFGASGLVAAVTAGLISGYRAPSRVGAEARLAEQAVWRTIELLLESAVFLVVGLELPSLVSRLDADAAFLRHPVFLAVVLGAAVLLIRAVFVSGAVWSLARRNRKMPAVREQLSHIQDQLVDGPVPASASPLAQRINANATTEERRHRWQRAISRRLADVDYLAAEQFGWRDGVILVWAGMRGAVTIAAAQSLPEAVPHRPLLVLTATFLAVGTLLLQGLTLTPLARRLGLASGDNEVDPERWRALQTELGQAALESLPTSPDGGDADLIATVRDRVLKATQSAEWSSARDRSAASWAKVRRMRLAALNAQREKLVELRGLGNYPSAMLDDALAELDAQQISLELRQQYD